MKCCFHIELTAPISLYQSESDRLFTVVYGEETKKDLTYVAAAAELGECIMHALACDGKLDNSGEG